MSLSILIPSIILIISVVVYLIWFIYQKALDKLKLSEPMERCFDERQKLIRGKGFKYAFWTAILLNLIYGFGLYEYIKSFILPQSAVIIISVIAGEVYSIYCILNDAFFAIKQNVISFLFSSMFIAVTNIAIAVINYGKNDFASVHLVIAFAAFADSVIVMTKVWSDRKETLNEKS